MHTDQHGRGKCKIRTVIVIDHRQILVLIFDVAAVDISKLNFEIEKYLFGEIRTPTSNLTLLYKRGFNQLCYRIILFRCTVERYFLSHYIIVYTARILINKN